LVVFDALENLNWQVDELLEENEQLIVDIDRHQQSKSKGAKQQDNLEKARKLIQHLNRNTHQVRDSSIHARAVWRVQENHSVTCPWVSMALC
jgi:hypothetical protein